VRAIDEALNGVDTQMDTDSPVAAMATIAEQR
jgi:hypothetical protein